MSEAAASAAFLLDAVAVYAVLGVAAALAFQVRHTPRFTLGARILIFPGMVALWPLLLRRWVAAR